MKEYEIDSSGGEHEEDHLIPLQFRGSLMALKLKREQYKKMQ